MTPFDVQRLFYTGTGYFCLSSVVVEAFCDYEPRDLFAALIMDADLNSLMSLSTFSAITPYRSFSCPYDRAYAQWSLASLGLNADDSDGWSAIEARQYIVDAMGLDFPRPTKALAFAPVAKPHSMLSALAEGDVLSAIGTSASSDGVRLAEIVRALTDGSFVVRVEIDERDRVAARCDAVPISTDYTNIRAKRGSLRAENNDPSITISPRLDQGIYLLEATIQLSSEVSHLGQYAQIFFRNKGMQYNEKNSLSTSYRRPQTEHNYFVYSSQDDLEVRFDPFVGSGMFAMPRLRASRLKA